MFSRCAGIMAISLCIAFFSLSVLADDTEAKLRELEARLIYEAASKLAEDEEYDKAIRRLDRIILQYPETEYAGLAESRKSEIAFLKLRPGPISGASRASLVGFVTLFTSWVGFGSWLLSEPSWFPSDAEAAVLGVIMIAAPLGGLTGSMRLTRNMRLSDGQASLINFSGYWGVWQATGAALIADASDRAVIGASMAGGVIGLAMSGSIVPNRYITPGDATMINFGGIWGTWFALCGAMLADMEEGDDILISSMIGGDVGLFTMAILSSKMGMSRARARLINIGGVIGTLYGLGANVLFDIDHKQDFWSVLSIGSVLGLAAGAYFTRGYDAEEGYFAGEADASAAFRWDDRMGTSAIAHGSTDSRQRRMTGMDIQIPLFNIRF